MNIIYITSSLPYGPGEAFILPELAELSKRGHQVWVVPMNGRGDLLHTGVQDLIHRCLSAKLLDRQIAFGAIAEFIRAPRVSVEAICMLWTPKLRHLGKNLSIVPKGLWLAREARRLDIHHIHVHWAATTASMGMVASEISGVPWSFTAHRWDIVESNLLDRKARHAQFVRFISKNGLHLARARGLSADIDAIVLHMGVRLPLSIAQKTRRSPKKHILCPANLIEVKGHRFLLDAMARLPDGSSELWLAGHGVLEKELREQVKRLGIEKRVRFLGQLPHQELLDLYRREEVDIVVLPSLDLGDGLHEGIPVSLIEAMGQRVPVVSTLTGGIAELLGDGAGLLVPPADVGALVDALKGLLEDSEKRRTIGCAGYNRVQSRFSITSVTEQLEQQFAKERVQA
ncbi:colanic acid biosynthesis glycosyltransferase WcaL [Deinococcus aerolatus]|uniref:Colanic acid biosynthesis glycosyltransferase WcaL n=1 Tax=Deinococcus aerolatus TaxID=522487 RepID=A0ABQ2GDT0_9DEIO|nr:glycosyltransferase [Deinococcus aerolatus]GGL90115.1 colanic acid biosynthesis glycosyltransferase WcaL [Deinococcus aerolatus]